MSDVILVSMFPSVVVVCLLNRRNWTNNMGGGGVKIDNGC
jgi:hypothetical protein